jgi:hypothetical protein
MNGEMASAACSSRPASTCRAAADKRNAQPQTQCGGCKSTPSAPEFGCTCGVCNYCVTCLQASMQSMYGPCRFSQSTLACCPRPRFLHMTCPSCARARCAAKHSAAPPASIAAFVQNALCMTPVAQTYDPASERSAASARASAAAAALLGASSPCAAWAACAGPQPCGARKACSALELASSAIIHWPAGARVHLQSAGHAAPGRRAHLCSAASACHRQVALTATTLRACKSRQEVGSRRSTRVSSYPRTVRARALDAMPDVSTHALGTL